MATKKQAGPNLSELEAEVSSETTVKGGVKKLITGIADALAQADDRGLLASALQSRATALAEAVADNTDAEDEDEAADEDDDAAT